MTRILFQTQTQEPLQDNHMFMFVLKGSIQAVVWDQGTNSIFYAVSSNAEWIRACIRVEFLTSDLIVFLESLPRLTKEHFSHQVFLRVFFHLQLEESRADAIMQLLQERQKRHKAQKEVDTLKSQSQCKIHEVSVIIIHSTWNRFVSGLVCPRSLNVSQLHLFCPELFQHVKLQMSNKCADKVEQVKKLVSQNQNQNHTL